MSVTVASGAVSADVSSSAWIAISEQYFPPGSNEAQGGDQAAGFFCEFTTAGATATIGVALVDASDRVYAYIEGFAKAGSRRTGADNTSGSYIGSIDFDSTTAPSTYASTANNKIDLMHGSAGGHGNTTDPTQEIKWVYGVTSLSAGSITVHAEPTPSI